MKKKIVRLLKNIQKVLAYLIYYCVDYCVALTTQSIHSGGLLLVRVDAIGDFIIWLDTAKEYRNLYPNKKITLYTNSPCYELAKTMPYWDSVISVDWHKFIRHPLYRFYHIKNISRFGYEVAIQPTYSRFFLHGDSMIRASRSLYRIGCNGDLSNLSAMEKIISDRWYTRLLVATKKPLMEIERNAEFISTLSGTKYNGNISILKKTTVLSDNLTVHDNYFIIFPGASSYIRQWPINKFVNVLHNIYQKYRLIPVICGSPSEIKLCQDISEQAHINVINLGGKTSLIEFVEIIRGAKILISNETSSIHISASVSTPSVCILGGGHFGRFAPYPEHLNGVKPLIAINAMKCFNCNWNCCYEHSVDKPVPCISGISVEQVIKLTDLVLK